MKFPVQHISDFRFIASCFCRFKLGNGIFGNKPLLLHDPANSASGHRPAKLFKFRLFFSSNEPDVLSWRPHLSKAEGVNSYSLMISFLGFPEACSWTICALNSFVNVLLSLLVMIDSPPTYIESSLYDLNESVQLSVTYP